MQNFTSIGRTQRARYVEQNVILFCGPPCNNSSTYVAEPAHGFTRGSDLDSRHVRRNQADERKVHNFAASGSNILTKSVPILVGFGTAMNEIKRRKFNEFTQTFNLQKKCTRITATQLHFSVDVDSMKLHYSLASLH